MAERSSVLIVAVVDDDQSVLRSLEYLLESADYVVRVFSSGKELLDSGCVPAMDCLISDMAMPDMEGYALLGAVRAARPELPVILITGYPEALRGVARLGDRPRCFTKPFSGPELLAAVGEAIRKLRG